MQYFKSMRETYRAGGFFTCLRLANNVQPTESVEDQANNHRNDDNRNDPRDESLDESKTCT